MNDIIARLKTDIEEESGTSPSFLCDLKEYMKAVEEFSKFAFIFGSAFENACFKITGKELAEMAKQFTKK